MPFETQPVYNYRDVDDLREKGSVYKKLDQLKPRKGTVDVLAAAMTAPTVILRLAALEFAKNLPGIFFASLAVESVFTPFVVA